MLQALVRGVAAPWAPCSLAATGFGRLKAISRLLSSQAATNYQEPATSRSLVDAIDNEAQALSPLPPTKGTSPLTIKYPFAIDYYKNLEAVVYSLEGEPRGLVALPGTVFNAPVRVDILHRVVRYLRAKWQQGTHKAKTRIEVRGGGRKPRPQKKTGMSRQGSIRSPIWVGGGVTHGSRPRSHAHDLPRATRMLGLKCALSARAHEGRLFVVDNLLDGARDYRQLKIALEELTQDAPGTTWLLVDSGLRGEDGGARLRKWLKCSVVMEALAPEELTVYHLLRYERLVLTRAAAGALAAQLTAPHRVAKPVKHEWWQQRKAAVQLALEELAAAERQQQQQQQQAVAALVR